MTARTRISVSCVEFARAHYADRNRGLLGWTSFLIDDALMVEGVAVRRTRTGRISLSFPEPQDSRGKRHRPVWPVDADARQVVEAQVLAALQRDYGDVL